MVWLGLTWQGVLQEAAAPLDPPERSWIVVDKLRLTGQKGVTAAKNWVAEVSRVVSELGGGKAGTIQGEN